MSDILDELDAGSRPTGTGTHRCGVVATTRHFRWAAPALPPTPTKGLSRNDAIASATDRAARAVAAPGGLGMLLAAPTIACTARRSRSTIRAAIVTGQQAWCQLFSEPGAAATWPASAARR